MTATTDSDSPVLAVILDGTPPAHISLPDEDGVLCGALVDAPNRTSGRFTVYDLRFGQPSARSCKRCRASLWRLAYDENRQEEYKLAKGFCH